MRCFFFNAIYFHSIALNFTSVLSFVLTHLLWHLYCVLCFYFPFLCHCDDFFGRSSFSKRLHSEKSSPLALFRTMTFRFLSSFYFSIGDEDKEDGRAAAEHGFGSKESTSYSISGRDNAHDNWLLWCIVWLKYRKTTCMLLCLFLCRQSWIRSLGIIPCRTMKILSDHCRGN